MSPISRILSLLVKMKTSKFLHDGCDVLKSVIPRNLKREKLFFLIPSRNMTYTIRISIVIKDK